MVTVVIDSRIQCFLSSLLIIIIILLLFLKLNRKKNTHTQCKINSMSFRCKVNRKSKQKKNQQKQLKKIHLVINL